MRFKSAFRTHPRILNFIEDLLSSFEIWNDAVSSTPPTFEDTITSRDLQHRRLTLDHLRKELTRLLSIARRECGITDEQRHVPVPARSAQRHAEFVAQLEQVYVAPGVLREGGARHDNDFSEIREIRTAPTQQELLSPHDPYLPVFLPGGPHHLPADSMEKHLDIQFRLLRQEMMYVVSLHQNLRSLKLLQLDDQAIHLGSGNRPRDNENSS